MTRKMTARMEWVPGRMKLRKWRQFGFCWEYKQRVGALVKRATSLGHRGGTDPPERKDLLTRVGNLWLVRRYLGLSWRAALEEWAVTTYEVD